MQQVSELKNASALSFNPVAVAPVLSPADANVQSHIHPCGNASLRPRKLLPFLWDAWRMYHPKASPSHSSVEDDSEGTGVYTTWDSPNFGRGSVFEKPQPADEHEEDPIFVHSEGAVFVEAASTVPKTQVPAPEKEADLVQAQRSCRRCPDLITDLNVVFPSSLPEDRVYMAQNEDALIAQRLCDMMDFSIPPDYSTVETCPTVFLGDAPLHSEGGTVPFEAREEPPGSLMMAGLRLHVAGFACAPFERDFVQVAVPKYMFRGFRCSHGKGITDLCCTQFFTAGRRIMTRKILCPFDLVRAVAKCKLQYIRDVESRVGWSDEVLVSLVILRTSTKRTAVRMVCHLARTCFKFIKPAPNGSRAGVNICTCGKPGKRCEDRRKVHYF